MTVHQRKEAAKLLATGETPAVAARAVGVTRQNISNLVRKNTSFQDEIATYRAQLMSTLVETGPQIFADAMGALHDIIKDTTQEPEDRTRAAIHITKHLVPSADAILAAQAKKDSGNDAGDIIAKVTEALRNHPEAARAVAAALLQGKEDDAA